MLVKGEDQNKQRESVLIGRSGGFFAITQAKMTHRYRQERKALCNVVKDELIPCTPLTGCFTNGPVARSGQHQAVWSSWSPSTTRQSWSWHNSSPTWINFVSFPNSFPSPSLTLPYHPNSCPPPSLNPPHSPPCFFFSLP